VLLLYVLWWCSWFNASNPLFSHRGAVNSVELNGTADELISGSSDQTTISWQVGDFLNPLANQSRGRSPDTGQAIRVVRYRPVDNDWMAVGLDNGEIQIRPLSSQGHPTALSLHQNDRVMDLAFTHDSRYLFSGHGSGAVLRWPVDYPQGDRTDTAILPIQMRQFDFAIYGIALVGKANPSLAIGGRYNRLILWNWQHNQVIDLNTSRPGSPSDYITSVDAVFFQPYLLATADNQGSIALWDLKPCLISNRPCDVIDQWQDAHSGEPIRDLALSPYGCYLASAGADGRVMLWPLSSAGTRSAPYREGIRIGRSPTSINAVDIKILDDDILIAFGDDNSHVNLRRHHRIHNALCDLPTPP
jgi:WD40 repeat protein